MSKVMITGAAGFIGFHLSRLLLERGHEVVGVDNLSDYYDVTLKEARLARLEAYDGFRMHRLDIADRDGMEHVFATDTPEYVVNLAAQAGVRYSLIDPHRYVESNIVGFLHVLEGCRHHGIRHLVYASSSSVYGANKRMPFSTHDAVDHPISLYAATKKADELIAHTYSHLYGIPVTGLRFFTVYGPWGRPDMALFLFAKAILDRKPIDVYNHGDMSRDLTYVDDIVEAISRVMVKVPECDPSWEGSDDPASSSAPYRLYNIGNSDPVGLMDIISLLERNLGSTAIKNFCPIQPGDVPATYADVADLERDIDFRPSTPVEEGIARFVEWYLDYYRSAGVA